MSNNRGCYGLVFVQALIKMPKTLRVSKELFEDSVIAHTIAILKVYFPTPSTLLEIH